MKTIALIQGADQGSADRNLAYTSDRIREAAKNGARIVATQELFLHPYFCQTQDSRLFDLAEEVPGPRTEALSALARELSVVLVASLFERGLPGIYHNTAVVIDSDGALLGKYRKAHIPDDPEYYEKYYFTPGQTLDCVFDSKEGKIGVLVCWDQWFPEAARAAALQGADVLFYPTAIAWHDHERENLGDLQRDAWQTVQQGHAISNGLPVCAVNRVGREGKLTFWGGSFVCGAFGQILAKADESESIVYASLDFSQTELQRREWPFFRDRRMELYQPLLDSY